MLPSNDAQLVAIAANDLDRENPGWYEKVNLDTLHLWSSSMCVLGQVYGNYVDAPHEIMHDAGGNTRHEFNIEERFQRFWVKEIESRVGNPELDAGREAADKLAAIRAELKLASQLKEAGHKDLAKQLRQRALARI